MAFDKSGTRNRVILIVAFGTVISLGALKFVFDSYFISMAEASAQEKIASPEALIRLREEEKKALENAPIPIDQAMSRVAAGREGAGAAIAPQPSDDTSAMKGWAQLPKTFDTAAPLVAAPPAPPVVATASDAGVDGSTTPSPTADGGTKPPTADAGAPGH
jgi:hypothetical protein